MNTPPFTLSYRNQNQYKQVKPLGFDAPRGGLQ